MKIVRRFTEAGESAYRDISFRYALSEIRNPDGSTAFRLDGIEVPESWSQTAIDLLAQKYLRQTGVPKYLKKLNEEGIPFYLQPSVPDFALLEGLPRHDRFGAEASARQVFDRIAGAWTYWGYRHKIFSTPEDARSFYDEVRYILAVQMAAPNSPQWFNTGLHWAYGITGAAQGHYFVKQESSELMQSENAFERPQAHACFIQSISDTLLGEGGIMDLWSREARLFKFGSGTGTNFSSLRSKHEALSGGGRSSGLMSFLKVGDAVAGSVKSGGTSRRAAKMIICDIDHPEIEEFIAWKLTEEHKVACLISGSISLNKYVRDIATAKRDTSELFGAKNSDDKFGSLGLMRRVAQGTTIPEGYIGRLQGYIDQGWEISEPPIYNADWQSQAGESRLELRV